MNHKHILITGGSGLIGTRLTELLLKKGYGVSHLGRHKREGDVRGFTWDIDAFKIEPEALKNIDAVVHLAGAGIADKPWTEKRKREILESRTRSAEILRHEFQKPGNTVKTFVTSSGMSYYGCYDDDRIFKEDDPPARDFLAEVTRQWEAEGDKIESLGIRTVKIRTGIVLSRDGGALEAMAKPIRWYAGAPLGRGNQLMSWIHLNDLCNIYCKALEDGEMHGPYNGVAPEIVTNRQMTKAIAKAINRPVVLPGVPAFVLKWLLGEMADMALKGCGLSCSKIQEAGFQFEFGTLEKALHDIYGRIRD